MGSSTLVCLPWVLMDEFVSEAGTITAYFCRRKMRKGTANLSTRRRTSAWPTSCSRQMSMWLTSRSWCGSTRLPRLPRMRRSKTHGNVPWNMTVFRQRNRINGRCKWKTEDAAREGKRQDEARSGRACVLFRDALATPCAFRDDRGDRSSDSALRAFTRW